MKILYNIYVYLIAFPILLLLTILTAIMTILFIKWPNCAFIHWVQAQWSKSFFRLLFLPVTVEGLEHIQQGQSYVFVSNHTSMFDVWLIYGYLPVIFKWMMKKELRKVPFVGTACAVAGHVYVDRSNPRAALESIRKMEKTLQGGVSTVIFPEGTRTRTGEMGRFKRGAFQIALDLGLPVIPISISGCFGVMKPHSWIANRCAVKLYVGEPINLSTYSKDQQQEAIDHVRELVAAHVEN